MSPARDVLLIDDILESGRTLSYARKLMEKRGASVLALRCCSTSPASSRSREGGSRRFECPDLFVVGYGMDVAHAFRELPLRRRRRGKPPRRTKAVEKSLEYPRSNSGR